MALKSVDVSGSFLKNDAAKFYVGSLALGIGVGALGHLLRKNGVELTGAMIFAVSVGGTTGAYLRHSETLRKEGRVSNIYGEKMCKRE